MPTLGLNPLGVPVRLSSRSGEPWRLLTHAYGQMAEKIEAPSLEYRIGSRRAGGYFLERTGRAVAALDAGELLGLLDEDMSCQLQYLRPNLYFVHAAALEFRGWVVLLVAPSGGGKSTTAWALCQQGFGYLSDELAPVEIGIGLVHPYPRALHLKRPPPVRRPRIHSALRTSRGIHCGMESSARRPSEARPLLSVFFLSPRAGRRRPAREILSPGVAATRLYANALNPLAHSGDGLDGAVRVARSVRCLQVLTGPLHATCALIRKEVSRLVPAAPPR